MAVVIQQRRQVSQHRWQLRGPAMTSASRGLGRSAAVPSVSTTTRTAPHTDGRSAAWRSRASTIPPVWTRAGSSAGSPPAPSTSSIKRRDRLDQTRGSGEPTASSPSTSSSRSPSSSGSASTTPGCTPNSSPHSTSRTCRDLHLLSETRPDFQPLRPGPSPKPEHLRQGLRDRDVPARWVSSVAPVFRPGYSASDSPAQEPISSGSGTTRRSASGSERYMVVRYSRSRNRCGPGRNAGAFTGVVSCCRTSACAWQTSFSVVLVVRRCPAATSPPGSR